MIDYLSLKKITAMHSDEINAAISRVVNGCWYLKGRETELFEAEYAHYIGTSCCVGCGNGLDALTLILRAYIELGVMNEGDEVIVPANTFIATILAISRNRLVPVLVEPRQDTLEIDDSLIEQAITPRCRAIMIVHLYGRCAYTERIGDICKRYMLKLIEDNAQAHGCVYKGKRTGSLGSAAAHSFYPGKNMGALGDAGAVTTSDQELADAIRTIANYGSERKYIFDYQGVNSRIDELQAAVLRVKLRYLDDENRRRKLMAAIYLDGIHNSQISLSPCPARDSVWHIFPVFCTRRDDLQQFLMEKGIQTMVHYPIPPHQQRCYATLSSLKLPVTERIHREELSLPLNPALSSEELNTIIAAVNTFI